ncbi:hypothetical protein Ahy_A02g009834 [Arachis hypogaea]|uniref:Rx N-terminal domain-containing protein n=1 Tax=Arachis hypogaea TaxID=3818 RepID=A0A445EIB6_ARAHY|nr:hypothetical protein Ahy_A02g009834 [Arachis hypogaea]
MAEALVVGALVSASISLVLNRLISPEFVNSVVSKKLNCKLVERLKTALLAAKALAADAEQKQFGNELVREWLDSLRDALYTADDLLDRVFIKAQIRQKVRVRLPLRLNLSAWKMVTKINKVVKRIEDLQKLKDSLDLKEIPMVQHYNSYILKQLSDDDCWSIFVDNASFPESNGSSELEEIGRKIVKRCDGLPLAAETLGRLLRSERRVEEWNRILSNDIWEFPMSNSKIVPALLISYYHLPAHLKRCFVYCSLYPKDYQFDKDELILLWMAEDLLRPPRKGETLEEVGCECFDDLASRLFFKQVKNDDEKYFVMHDLIHVLATFLAGDFYYRFSKELGEKEERNILTRHLSYTHSIPEKACSSSEIESLRTLLYVNDKPYIRGERATLPCDILSKNKYLRILSFDRLNIFPDSIGKLIQVRYLGLSRSDVEILPESLCNLCNLQILKLQDCSKLTMLPNGMCNLVNLRCLDIRGTPLKEMPKGMGKLKQLHILSNFVVGKQEDNGIQELGELLNLHGSLEIEKLENVVDGNEARSARIIDKKHIEELLLKWSVSSGDDDMVSNTHTDEQDILHGLQPHRVLKVLRIKGYKGKIFPDWLGRCSYSNMTRVSLLDCKNCCMLPSLGQLPSLKSLCIERFDQLKSIGKKFYKNEGHQHSSPIAPFASLTCHVGRSGSYLTQKPFLSLRALL